MGHSPATLSRASLFMACVNPTIRLSFTIFGPTPALIFSKNLKTHLYSAWMAESLLPAIEILRQRLQANGVPCQSYSAHSFHKGAAQHASCMMTAHRLPSNKPGMAAENRLPPEEPLLVIDKLTPTSKLTNKANLMKVPSLILPLFDQLDSAAFFRRPVRGFDGNYAAL